MYELTPSYIVALISVGFIAGIINTMAGGGSNLTIPALMVLGLPPEFANATNRVSVLLQSITATKGFKDHGKLDIPDLKWILFFTSLGGVAGAMSASYLPSELLKPLLLSCMIITTLVILIHPSAVIAPENAIPHTVMSNKKSIPFLVLAGFYGGFVQAGVGFILIAAMAGSLRYDLVRANALKVVCTALFTAVALVFFIARDQVLWVPGLLLAVGSIVGAHLAVKLTIKVSQYFLKWFLFIMTLVASAAAIWI